MKCQTVGPWDPCRGKQLAYRHTHTLTLARGRRRGEHSTHTHTAEAPALAKALPLVVATELRITLPVLHYKYRGVGSVCVWTETREGGLLYCSQKSTVL